MSDKKKKKTQTSHQIWSNSIQLKRAKLYTNLKGWRVDLVDIVLSYNLGENSNQWPCLTTAENQPLVQLNKVC